MRSQASRTLFGHGCWGSLVYISTTRQRSLGTLTSSTHNDHPDLLQNARSIHSPQEQRRALSQQTPGLLRRARCGAALLHAHAGGGVSVEESGGGVGESAQDRRLSRVDAGQAAAAGQAQKQTTQKKKQTNKKTTTHNRPKTQHARH